MSKLLKPRLKLCKREKIDLFFLSGIKDIKKKCNLNKYSKTKRVSDYSLQLREKQKLKRIFNISETQFKNYFLKIKKLSGDKIINLLNLLEMRLENILFKSGLVLTKFHARQLINHKLVYVNNKRVNIPSYILHKNDNIYLSNKLLNNNYIQSAINLNKNKFLTWLDINFNTLSFKIISIPDINYIYNLINKDLIIELYSK